MYDNYTSTHIVLRGMWHVLRNMRFTTNTDEVAEAGLMHLDAT